MTTSLRQALVDLHEGNDEAQNRIRNAETETEAVLAAGLDGWHFEQLVERLDGDDLDTLRRAIISTYREIPQRQAAVDLRGRTPPINEPLPAALTKTFEAYLPYVLGVDDPVFEPLVKAAAARLDAYVEASPPHEKARSQIFILLTWTFIHGFFVGGLRPPWLQSVQQRKRFVEKLYRSDDSLADAFFELIRHFIPSAKPSVRDMAKSVREMMGLAFYSNSDADWITGYQRIWSRAEHFAEVGRLDVDPRRLADLKQPNVFDPIEAAKVHHQGHPYDASRLFANDGRPKVAIIGSGAGGAVVAAKLAALKRFDVAVFEAGPRMRPGQYPLDTFVGMGQLFEDGLMTLSRNLDIHLLRGRLVGGGTVMTSGLSVKLRPETMSRWCATDGELSIGVSQDELHRGFAEVEDRQRMEWINPHLFTDPSHLLEKGARRLGPSDPRWQFERDTHRNNVMMRSGQARGVTPDQHGEYCLGCGLCNYGCHFGHKLSMDLSYIPDAERHGARIHQNLPIERLIGEHDENGKMQVRALELGRGLKTRIEVDHVVLCAGAVGTPALLLETAHQDGSWCALPPFQDKWVGTHFGFNYGSGVLAHWPERFAKPGHLGFQIKYVATKASDPESFSIELPEGYRDRFVLENAFVPPGLISNLATGIGEHHRRWMARYRAAAMCATTLGSPQHGAITRRREVIYQLQGDELALNRQALASIARLYFAAGAEEVGLAGVREHPSDSVAPLGEGLRLTRDKFGDKTEAQIAQDLEAVITHPEHIMLSSAHPQGGLRLSAHAESGAVGPDFRLRGTANLSVMDASLFPSTIVVNPQWTIAALATIAAPRIAATIS